MQNRTLKDRWDDLQMGAKFISIVCIASSIMQLFFSGMPQYLPNDELRVVDNYQIWRLFTSFLINGSGIALVINLPLALYMLLICAPQIERRFSTIYIILEYFIQLFICNLTLVVIGYPLINLDVITGMQIVGFGITPLIFNFLWQAIMVLPQMKLTFCKLPWQISLKYLPWGYLVIITAIGHPFISNSIYLLLGIYQHYLRQRLVPLPLSVYTAIENKVPSFLKNFQCFIKIQNTEKQLKMVSAMGWCDFEWNESTASTQPIKIERVMASRQGRVISNSQKETSNYKDYWASKNIENNNEIGSATINKGESEQQVEPTDESYT